MINVPAKDPDLLISSLIVKMCKLVDAEFESKMNPFRAAPFKPKGYQDQDYNDG